MSLTRLLVEPILTSQGFGKESSLGNRPKYSLTINLKWKIIAHPTFIGNMFLGTENLDEFESISFTLDSKGTIYRCFSVQSLKSNLTKVLNELHKVANNEDLLKCPKCNLRYVYAKEPPSDKRWKPFLSCEGMVVTCP